MDPNEILAARDALMRDCGGDLARFGDLRRPAEARWTAAGHPVVSFEGQPPVELPPVDWGKSTLPRRMKSSSPKFAPASRALAFERDPRRAKEPDSLIVREDPTEP